MVFSLSKGTPQPALGLNSKRELQNFSGYFDRYRGPATGGRSDMPDHVTGNELCAIRQLDVLVVTVKKRAPASSSIARDLGRPILGEAVPPQF